VILFFDTTVLVYAVGADHPLRDPCRSVVDAIGAGRLAGTTTIETIQEFAHVRAARRGRADAVRLARSYAALLAPLLRPDRDDLERGLDLFASTPELGAFDAVAAATVLNHDEIDALVSADNAFSKIPALQHADPATPGFTERWGSPSG
jgi:predicted nucleic acid-binding protein